MAISPFARRAIALVGLGVALPALALAIIGIILSLRIAGSVENDAHRYNSYVARQVGAAYEQELMDHLRLSITAAEGAARDGASDAELRAALDAERGEFAASEFVPVERLDGFMAITVEGLPLIYAPGEGRHAGEVFAGLLLNTEGDPLPRGVGGWWVNPREFLIEHLDEVMLERLPATPRLYGGFESMRRLSIALYAPDGTVLRRLRDPGGPETAGREPFEGPFESFSIEVVETADAPVGWTRKFLTIQIAFIALMTLAIVGATAFGLRHLIRQLELAQLKSGFVSNVTHELKTPIALIRLAVETLEMRRVRSLEEGEQFIRAIGRETLRLSQLVDNILDFARLEAGQRVFRFEELDIGQVVHDTLDSFRPRFEHLGFTVQESIPEDLPTVRGDTIALTHCVLNLLDNAMKYSRERREVKVAVAVRDRFVAVSVSDRGIGIAPRDQKRIFEKFVRVDTGLVHDIKGAGLGLSLVDQIVRAHEGRVELTSTPGEGSTFTLLLPIAGERSSVEPEQRTAS